MAAEYVLIPRHKYEQLEKDANTPEDTSKTSSGVDDVTMEDNRKVIRGDYDGATPTNSPNTEINLLDKRNDVDLDVSDDSMSPDDYVRNNDYATSDILQSFDPSELKYVQPIMDEMERHEDILTWDKQTGEILYQLEKVPDSNIIELLKDTLTAHLHPIGKMEFYRGLDMMNVQTKYIKHSKNKAPLNILRGKIMETKNVVKKKKIKRIKSNNLNTNNNKGEWISWM